MIISVNHLFIKYLSVSCVPNTFCEGLDVKREHAWPFARKNWLISVFKSCVLYSKVELLRKCHCLSQNDFHKTRVCPSLWGPMGIGPCPSLFSGNMYQARLQADHGWWAASLHNGTASWPLRWPHTLGGKTSSALHHCCVLCCFAMK